MSDILIRQCVKLKELRELCLQQIDSEGSPDDALIELLREAQREIVNQWLPIIQILANAEMLSVFIFDEDKLAEIDGKEVKVQFCKEAATDWFEIGIGQPLPEVK